MGFIQFVKNIFRKENQYESEMIDGIELDQIYHNRDVALDVVKRIQKLVNDQESYKPEYEVVVEELTTVEQVIQLKPSIIEEIELMSASYSESLLKKDDFRKVVDKEYPEIEYLDNFTDDLEKVIKDLKEAEDKQRVVKRDLDYLDVEKSEIIHKRKRYNSALEMLKVLLGLVGGGALIATIVFTALIYSGQDVMIPGLITSGVIVAVGLYIFVFRRYLIYEIKRGYKLDKKAVSIANKIKLKYVKNQQYLDFVYKKYKVISGEMLELRYDNFQKLMRNRERYKKLTRNLSALLGDIEHMLHQYNVLNPKYVTEHLDYFSSEKSRLLLQESLKERKDAYTGLIRKNEKEIEFMFNILKEVDEDITMEDVMDYKF